MIYQLGYIPAPSRLPMAQGKKERRGVKLESCRSILLHGLFILWRLPSYPIYLLKICYFIPFTLTRSEIYPFHPDKACFVFPFNLKKYVTTFTLTRSVLLLNAATVYSLHTDRVCCLIPCMLTVSVILFPAFWQDLTSYLFHPVRVCFVIPFSLKMSFILSLSP